jgi:hypothetical protein
MLPSDQLMESLSKPDLCSAHMGSSLYLGKQQISLRSHLQAMTPQHRLSP